MKDDIIQTPVASSEATEDGLSQIDHHPDSSVMLPDISADLICSMQDGFLVLDASGVARDANPSLYRMTGFSTEELIGTDPPHPYWPPEEYERLEESLQETLKGVASTSELIFMRKSGERFPVLVSAFSLFNPQGEPVVHAACVIDITDRKKTEDSLRSWNQSLERRVAERTAELKLSQNRFKQLSEASFEGVVVSENGIIVDGNSQIAEMMGYDLSEMIGQRIIDFVTPESRFLVMQRIMNEEEGRYEFTGMRKNGTSIPMQAHGRKMIWEGKASRVTALKDLTADKLAAARLAEQKAKLDQALKLAIISEISAGIIHQIGQPLTAIGVNLAAATAKIHSGDMDLQECLRILKELEANVFQMRSSITHLRALANPGQQFRIPMDFNEMVSQAIHQIRPDADKNQVVLLCEFSPEQPEMRADSVQLRQVVVNLVCNALEACADCSSDRRKVHIRTRMANHDSVELSVTDEGIGIDPLTLDHLYSPFHTTKPDGFGIGLCLSRTIVQSHGGIIEGRNNDNGIGATFRVVLPLNLD